jgi:hypothetical protein
MDRDPDRIPFTVACPVCQQGRGFACRTLSTGRVTDVHLPRYDAAYGASTTSSSPSSKGSA